MAQWAIVIFPLFADVEQAAEIERVQREFDPLAGVLAAHITLVFPFERELNADTLDAHMRAAARGIGRFPVTLGGVTVEQDDYLSLHVWQGWDEICALHDRLYTGPLAEHLSQTHVFVPHLTVGRLTRKAALKMVKGPRLIRAQGIVAEARALTLYRIEEGARAIERVVELE
jgi:2'-5' RNA ligase